MRFSHSIRGLSVGAALATFASFGVAQAATQVLTYKVEHPTYGNIGTYTNTVSQNGNEIDVRTDLHVAVKVVGIPLFRQDATREEHWENQRLVSFQGATDDNGTKITVTGKADGDGFNINSTSNGLLSAPARVHPSNPWAPFVLQTDTMMSTKTGRVSEVTVKDTGEVMQTFDGRQMRVHQWFVDDEKHQVVWIDERGVVVGFQTSEDGKPINFVLTRETASTDSTPALANN